jgi:hypothetical protein
MDNQNQSDFKVKRGIIVIPGEVIASEDKGYMA